MWSSCIGVCLSMARSSMADVAADDEDEEAEDVSAFVDVGGLDAAGALCGNHWPGCVNVS